MEWRDDGLIIGLKKHGETSVILEAMTRAHGRHFGLVRGGRSRRMQPYLQPGNQAELVWRARLDEHLGTFCIEPGKLRTEHLMASAEALHAMGLVAALLRLAAERDPHPLLYEMAMQIADDVQRPENLPPLVVRFEAEILTEMGFGLDLAQCAATGATDDLVYVSPKSGRAVSKAAGEPYKTKLLRLPPFLQGETLLDGLPLSDIRDGFRLMEFFLMRDLYGPRGQGLPEAHGAYLTELAKRPGWAA
ncbi:DNA repair protein RecO [Beijerinckiaceae bacterium]|nr:DNA repair protein RecO [Beijerinckiaceae bacterium]